MAGWHSHLARARWVVIEHTRISSLWPGVEPNLKKVEPIVVDSLMIFRRALDWKGGFGLPTKRSPTSSGVERNNFENFFFQFLIQITSNVIATYGTWKFFLQIS